MLITILFSHNRSSSYSLENIYRKLSELGYTDHEVHAYVRMKNVPSNYSKSNLQQEEQRIRNAFSDCCLEIQFTLVLSQENDFCYFEIP